MRFFVPCARSPEEAIDVYKAIKKHIGDGFGSHFSSRKVKSLKWKHEGKKHEAEVGKITSFNSELVIAILYEPKRELFHVCTPTRGVLRGMSILVGSRSMSAASDFEKEGLAKWGAWSGKDSGCPFCIAKTHNLPKVGEKVRFLSEYRAGEIGIVVAPPPQVKDKLTPREFMVKMERDASGNLLMCNRDNDLFDLFPGTPVPGWAPPISMSEAANLHKCVIDLCNEISFNDDGSFSKPLLNDLIRHIWLHRLPIEPNEMWDLLAAHGAPKRWRKKIACLYTEGRELLVYAAGRRPIKRKRVPPLTS